MLVHLLVAKQPWPTEASTPLDPWRCAVVTGTKMFAADPCTWSATTPKKLVCVRLTSTWMAGPKVSQQNIAQSITRPPPACFLPIVHPGTMCSPGKWRIRTRPSTWCKRNRDSSDQATFFHCSVVRFWCSHETSNPYTCPFFLLLTHQLWGQHVNLLPNVSHPLTGAMMKRQSVLFTSPVSSHNVMPDQCIFVM